MTVSELKTLLEKYPGEYHVVLNTFQPLVSTEDDFMFLKPKEYKQAIENGDIDE